MQPSNDSIENSSHNRHWLSAISLRLRAHWLLKGVGTTAYMSVFFIVYFHIMKNPAADIAIMPLTFVDQLISFQPAALIPYVTLWIYVSLAPALILDRRELVGYGIWIAALCIAGLLCFYLWPTTVILPTDEWRKHASFSILQGVDAAANACPSMHVAAALFTACWLNHILRDIGAPSFARAMNWLWLIAISYSTMAIKQHVFIDVIAGLALGLIFVLPSLKYRWHDGSAALDPPYG